jgi:hypothetical protein
MTSGMLTPPAKVMMDMKTKGKSDITFGQTVPTGTIQISPQTGKGAFVARGATTTLDVAMIQSRHSDSSGVTTTAHELNNAIDIQAGKTGAALQQVTCRQALLGQPNSTASKWREKART